MRKLLLNIEWFWIDFTSGFYKIQLAVKSLDVLLENSDNIKDSELLACVVAIKTLREQLLNRMKC